LREFIRPDLDAYFGLRFEHLGRKAFPGSTARKGSPSPGGMGTACGGLGWRSCMCQPIFYGGAGGMKISSLAKYLPRPLKHAKSGVT
jgi:hypothetical protein